MFNLQAKAQNCFVQNEESSIVYGMPKVAHELNPKAHVIDLKEIPHALLNCAKK